MTEKGQKQYIVGFLDDNHNYGTIHLQRTLRQVIDFVLQIEKLDIRVGHIEEHVFDGSKHNTTFKIIWNEGDKEE